MITQSKTKVTYTPGPWTVNGTAIEDDPRDAPTSHIASLNDDLDEWRANARLIAAGPTQNAALHKIVNAWDEMRRGSGNACPDLYTTAFRHRSDSCRWCLVDRAMSSARAAIRLAEGEE